MPERDARPVDGARLRAIVEALVFAAEEPLTLADLRDLFPDTESPDLQAALDDVAKACESSERGLQVIRVAGGYRMTTRADLGEWVRALFRSRHRRRLSPAALETLAIVAYRQPLGRAEIEEIRGVGAGAVLKTLQEREMIEVVGRGEGLGRPLLYGTTRRFLEHFGFRTLADLPRPEELPVVLRSAERSTAGA